MKRILAIIALLLCANPAWAAITHIGTLGSANSGASGTTLALTTSAALEAGNVSICEIALDNTATGDGNESEISTIVDSAGNTYTYIRSYRNGQGSAGAGAQIEVWQAKAVSELAIGGTITVTFANTITRKAITCREFTVGAGNTLSMIANATDEAKDAASPGSMVISGLVSLERLYLRATALEVDSGSTITVSTNFTSFGMSRYSGGTDLTSMKQVGEFRINTSTGETSAYTLTFSNLDNASVFVALEEVAARRPIPPIIFQ